MFENDALNVIRKDIKYVIFVVEKIDKLNQIQEENNRILHNVTIGYVHVNFGTLLNFACKLETQCMLVPHKCNYN